MQTIKGGVVIFAGAGASKAVRPEKFPTTREFFEGLSAAVSEQSLFKLAVQYLKQVKKVEDVDIEQVLWALQNLHDFFGDLASPKEFIGFSLQQGVVEKVYGAGQSAGQIVSLAPAMRDQISYLIGEINQVVYDLYSYEPSPKELRNNWGLLISSLDGMGSSFDIFTTNYDVVGSCTE